MQSPAGRGPGHVPVRGGGAIGTRTARGRGSLTQAALDVLTVERLEELARRYGLRASGSVGALRRRLTRAPALTERALLQFLCTFELRELCRARGLEAGGGDAGVLRRRLAGLGRAPELGATRAASGAGELDLPPELLEEWRQQRRTRARELLAGRLSRAVRVLLWCAAGGFLARFLATWMTDSEEALLDFGIGGAVATAIVKLRRQGRFGGMFIYGGTIVAGTFIASALDLLDLDGVGHSRLCLAWGVAIFAGALAGIVEELEQS